MSDNTQFDTNDFTQNQIETTIIHPSGVAESEHLLNFPVDESSPEAVIEIVGGDFATIRLYVEDDSAVITIRYQIDEPNEYRVEEVTDTAVIGSAEQARAVLRERLLGCNEAAELAEGSVAKQYDVNEAEKTSFAEGPCTREKPADDRGVVAKEHYVRDEAYSTPITEIPGVGSSTAEELEEWNDVTSIADLILNERGESILPSRVDVGDASTVVNHYHDFRESKSYPYSFEEDYDGHHTKERYKTYAYDTQNPVYLEEGDLAEITVYDDDEAAFHADEAYVEEVSIARANNVMEFVVDVDGDEYGVKYDDGKWKWNTGRGRDTIVTDELDIEPTGVTAADPGETDGPAEDGEIAEDVEIDWGEAEEVPHRYVPADENTEATSVAPETDEDEAGVEKFDEETEDALRAGASMLRGVGREEDAERLEELLGDDESCTSAGGER